MTKAPPTFQGNNVFNLRDVFCGSKDQHSEVIASSAQFLKSNRPGIFVIGGTNLTGKTTLMQEILLSNGLLDFLEGENIQPDKRRIRFDMEFSDQNSREASPKNITAEDLYAYDKGIILKGLNMGVNTIFLNEIWAGHEQALKLIQDELVNKRGFRVFIDVVSSGEGKGFFDGEANNRYIEAQMNKIFTPQSLRLHLLDFNQVSLMEGVRLLAEYHENSQDLAQNLYPFPKDLRVRLGKAYSDQRLDSELNSILVGNIYTSVERR